MHGYWCSFKFGIENSYYVGIENVERDTLELYVL